VIDVVRRETIWREPTTHAVENVGDTEAHAIAVDLKTPGQKRKVGSKSRKLYLRTGVTNLVLVR
jgi:hypothetical protein